MATDCWDCPNFSFIPLPPSLTGFRLVAIGFSGAFSSGEAAFFCKEDDWAGLEGGSNRGGAEGGGIDGGLTGGGTPGGGGGL